MFHHRNISELWEARLIGHEIILMGLKSLYYLYQKKTPKNNKLKMKQTLEELQ